MVRDWLEQLTEIIVPFIDLIALVALTGGTLEAAIAAVRLGFVRPGQPSAGREIWLRYSRWLVAGLTFQLAADIIETSAAPGWEDIGKLAAIAVIRTFLNYFLERDQREIEKDEREERRRADATPP